MFKSKLEPMADILASGQCRKAHPLSLFALFYVNINFICRWVRSFVAPNAFYGRGDDLLIFLIAHSTKATINKQKPLRRKLLDIEADYLYNTCVSAVTETLH